MADDVFPDRDMDHADKIAWVVETNGWCAEPVAPVNDPPTPGYTYSIGFGDTYDHPDVVIFGLQPAAARGLIEMLATLPEGMFVGLLDGELPCALLPVDMSLYAEMFPGATQFYGDEGCYRVSQFVWPDRTGHMPWDAEYDERLRLAQPVVGT